MSEIRSYRDLKAWQMGMSLAKQVYNATKSFPRDQQYGLSLQLRRAAVSVPSNIAEGYGRGSRRDYINFLHTARGSLYEAQTQILLAKELACLTPGQAGPLLESAETCSRILNGLITSLKRKAT